MITIQGNKVFVASLQNPLCEFVCCHSSIFFSISKGFSVPLATLSIDIVYITVYNLPREKDVASQFEEADGLCGLRHGTRCTMICTI